MIDIFGVLGLQSHRPDRGGIRQRRAFPVAFALLPLLIAMPAGARGLAASQDRSAQSVEDLRRQLLAQPGMAKIMRDQFRAAAMRIVRLERMVAIGQMCHVLQQDDADQILANGDADLEDDRRMLADQDAGWAETYLAGVRMGAMQSADLVDVTDEAGCAKFAKPGGALTRIMTWTDKPQEIAPGIAASPRTLP